MTTLPSGPLDSPEHLMNALIEQGETREDARDLLPALLALSTWDAPEPAAEQTGQLVAALAPHAPAPSTNVPVQMSWRGAAAHAVGVLTFQARLIHRSIWVASALGLLAATLYAWALQRPSAEQALGVFVPVIVAAGVAFLYGKSDAGLELALASPTSPRLILLNRVMLLVGFDLALALGGTAFVSVAHGGSVTDITGLWLGPMALLSAGSLLTSLVLGPLVAVCGAAAVWLAPYLPLGDGFSSPVTTTPVVTTSPLTFALTLALVLVALLYVPRREQFDAQR